MKKQMLILTAAALMLLSGCTASAEAPALSLPAEADFTLKTTFGEYECTTTHLSDTVDSVTINAPESLKGLTFRRTNGEYAIIYGSLLSRYESLRFPEEALPSAAQELSDYLRQNSESIILTPTQDHTYTCTGESASCTFTLTTDSSGTMTTLTAAAKK